SVSETSSSASPFKVGFLSMRTRPPFSTRRKAFSSAVSLHFRWPARVLRNNRSSRSWTFSLAGIVYLPRSATNSTADALHREDEAVQCLPFRLVKPGRRVGGAQLVGQDVSRDGAEIVCPRTQLAFVLLAEVRMARQA